MAIADIVSIYVDCMAIALPVTIVFFFGDFIVTTVLRAMLGGRLTFRT